jgi:hypothetical protein
VVAGLRFRAEQYCQSNPAQSSWVTADFGFSYVSADGTNGLSQPYAGPTATGQSYGTGVAVDSSQEAYTLVQANADVGCGWLPGLLPGQQRHDRAQLYQPSYLGPYYIVRRTTNGAIDTAFGAKGYVKTLNGSDDTNDKFTSLCIVPGSGDHRHRTGRP